MISVTHQTYYHYPSNFLPWLLSRKSKEPRNNFWIENLNFENDLHKNDYGPSGNDDFLFWKTHFQMEMFLSKWFTATRNHFQPVLAVKKSFTVFKNDLQQSCKWLTTQENDLHFDQKWFP